MPFSPNISLFSQNNGSHIMDMGGVVLCECLELNKDAHSHTASCEGCPRLPFYFNFSLYRECNMGDVWHMSVDYWSQCVVTDDVYLQTLFGEKKAC